MLSPYPKLKDEFPSLFVHISVFECGPGWHNLIYNLAKDLTDHLKECSHCKEIVATQVKEKYGGLRFYIEKGCDLVYLLIHEAEDQSTIICESCGDEGESCPGPWMKVRCKECYEKEK